jgi:CRISPR-associated endonuclease Csn1
MDGVESSSILGIDLGASSVGWALIRVEKGSPTGIIRAGARVFEAAVTDGIESGREESKGKARRDARQQRRQTWRQARRIRRVFQLLQRSGLLPAGDASASEARQNLLTDLDNSIAASDWFKGKLKENPDSETYQVWPYLLRAAALTEPLEPHHLGRALYHLAQRRGFLSNRKEAGGTDKEKEQGIVKKKIGELREAMGGQTLGEYFSNLHPSESRIRTRYTERSMYKDEFERIWSAQQQFHPAILTPALKKEFFDAIFFQRKLWFSPNLVGKCELEKEEIRAPAHLIISQRFRFLQLVNNLKLSIPGQPECDLTPEERNLLVNKLSSEGDLTFKAFRKLPGFAKADFNLERGGEERIPGDRTSSELAGIFGDRWQTMSPAERDQVVHYVWSFEKPEKLANAARKKWNLDEETSEKLASISLEPGYLNLSVKAMRKIVPLLEKGKTFAEARRELYPGRWESDAPLDLLPSVNESQEVLGQIRNPAVIRALTELRKVVNAVVRQYGKPGEIHIELARDLRNPRKRRQAMAEENRENEKLRKQAARKILDWNPGMRDPSRRDVQKVLLAQECHWECPYTGRPISMDALLGPEPQFDIEHIIPFSRSLDNSFGNLTLCEAQENRNVKKKQTPREAYAGDPEKYDQIISRVNKFSSKHAKRKFSRFVLSEEGLAELTSDFAERQLNDTRYATRLAADYVALLYGGRTDAEKKLRVRTTVGHITGFLRWEWKLNSILNDGDSSDGGEKPKSRADHRHHAVDAIVTALTNAGSVAMLSRAAERAPSERRRLFGSVEAPWPDFTDSIRKEIKSIVVSHRPTRRVRGPLHEQTLYSRPFQSKTAGKRGATLVEKHRVRKLVSTLSSKEVRDIVDAGAKALVEQKLIELGGEEPKVVFNNEANLPFFTAHDGRRIPIKRVRVEKAIPTIQLGSGRSARYVKPESNHHVEILAEVDKNGKETGWTAEVVSLADAIKRRRERHPVVKKDHGEGFEFRFSLARGEALECKDEKRGDRRLFVVRGCTQLSAGSVQIFLTAIEDARMKKEQVDDEAYLRPVPNTLRRWAARKVRVTPLGDMVQDNE